MAKFARIKGADETTYHVNPEHVIHIQEFRAGKHQCGIVLSGGGTIMCHDNAQTIMNALKSAS